MTLSAAVCWSATRSGPSSLRMALEDGLRSALPFLDRKGPLTWEPPIGIEPMTYALRGRFDSSTAVRWITPAQHAGVLAPAKSEVVQRRC